MKRVLVADDDYITVEMFKEAIESLGHDVVAVAHNSEEAIDQACALLPDIAFLDIRMDYRTAGIHAANHIKYRHPQIKVYFLSAYTKDIFHSELIGAQYDGYIDKLKFTDAIKTILQ